MEIKIIPPQEFINLVNQIIKENKMENTWPLAPNFTDSNITINQRMVHHLLERKGTPKNRDMQALGIEVAELRDEAGMSRKKLTALSGIDCGFLALLEEGHALPYEIDKGLMARLSCSFMTELPIYHVKESLWKYKKLLT